MGCFASIMAFLKGSFPRPVRWLPAVCQGLCNRTSSTSHLFALHTEVEPGLSSEGRDPPSGLYSFRIHSDLRKERFYADDVRHCMIGLYGRRVAVEGMTSQPSSFNARHAGCLRSQILRPGRSVSVRSQDQDSFYVLVFHAIYL